ncbi:MAG: hypothetical protein PHF60_03725 [Candidatus ainarchaeum sp.]|nr:hypothetical protein [Candidatus ainarchaeum sp.]
MRKAELLLLLLIPLCSALIDPPVDDVMEHNRGLALSQVLDENVFDVPERTPSLGNPTIFFYARILTLNPAVNGSVTGNKDLHPELIWLVAENHVNSLTEINGQVVGYEADFQIKQYTQRQEAWNGEEGYIVSSVDENGSLVMEYQEGGEQAVTWADSEPEIIELTPPEEDDSCDKTTITRTYGELTVDEMTADYSVDGLAKEEDEAIIYETASQTVILADNETSFQNPSPVPFKSEGFWCMLTGFISDYILGGMVDLTCDTPLLSRASPYPTGVYNVTVRNITIVKPRLNVTLYATFKIPYEENGESCHETDEGCECEDWEDEGNITISSSDFKSYEVQNDYMTVIPYSPSFLNFSANTSENVVYYFSFLSNSELYKYYSKMDGKTGNAFYYQSFNVTEDAYGTQFINAQVMRNNTLLPEDPESANNYTGQRRILKAIDGNYLRSPTEINNMSYNYSNIYNIEEVYYNLTPGDHHADLMFYTWWGNYSDQSDIHSRVRTFLQVKATTIGDQVNAACTLTDKDGKPLDGKPIILTIGNMTRYATVNGGVCNALFDFNGTGASVTASFEGDDSYLPSSNYQLFATGKSLDIGQGLVINNPMLLLLFALMVGMAAMSMIGAGANGGQLPVGKFFPFARKPEGKKMIRKKSSKEIATQVAMALATGGAGAAAGSKMAEEAVKKKVAEDVAKKELEKRVRMEMEKKGKKKVGKGTGKKVAGTKKRVGTQRKKTEPRLLDAIAKKKGAVDEWVAVERMKGDRTHVKTRDALEQNEVRKAWEKIGNELSTSINKIEGRTDAQVLFKVSPDGQRFIRVDNIYTPWSFTVPRDDLWAGYCKASGQGDNMAGVTIGRQDIYIPKKIVDDRVEFHATYLHEPWHVICKFDNPGLREGTADRHMFIAARTSEDIPGQIKKEINIGRDYRDYAAADLYVESIVGKHHYNYALAKGGENYLETRFDNQVGKVGEYERIFYKVDPSERVDELKIAFKNVETDAKVREIIVRAAERIEDHGTFKISEYNKALRIKEEMSK